VEIAHGTKISRKNGTSDRGCIVLDQRQRMAIAGVVKGSGLSGFAMRCGSQNRDPSGNSPGFNHARVRPL